MSKRKSKAAVLKILFLLSSLCCMAAIMFFPLRSSANGTLAGVTIALPGDAYGFGIHPDRHFDLPTGNRYYDVPVWLIDLGLYGISALFLLLLVRLRSDDENTAARAGT